MPGGIGDGGGIRRPWRRACRWRRDRPGQMKSNLGPSEPSEALASVSIQKRRALKCVRAKSKCN